MEPKQDASNIARLREEDRLGFRQPPHNIEAEQALLGALLMNNLAYNRVSDFLQVEHFIDALHGRIYDAISRLIERGQVASPVTLKPFFENDETLAKMGGVSYLARLASATVGIVNVADYARQVHDLFIRRQLIDIGETVVNDAYLPQPDITAVDQLEVAEKKLYDLAQTGQVEGGFQSFRVAVTEAVKMAEAAFQREGKLTGVATGLYPLDRLLGGLHKSDLIILAGRPGMGKSALATNIAFNVAATYREGLDENGKRIAIDGGNIGFFSLEMSSEQLATRILAEQAGVPSEKIRRGELIADDFHKVIEASQELEMVPMFIDDTPALSIAALRTRARRLKRQHGLELIVVDYLQLLQPSGKSRQENRVQEISEITRGLKTLAKELDVPVLALSQLSRAVEQREDKRPQLADLRESGSIEQDADVVMFIYREEYYVGSRPPQQRDDEPIDKYHDRYEHWQQRCNDVSGKAEVIIAKQRHGPTGTALLQFDGPTTKFDNPAEGADGAPGMTGRAGEGNRDFGGATLEIDLDAIAANWRALALRATPAQCSAVIKADGYGLGAVPVAQRLWAEGARLFFVAHLEEALSVRAILPDAEIAVLNGLAAGGLAEHVAHRLTAVLNRPGDARLWQKAADRAARRLPAFVHADTGMNRLGMSLADAQTLAADAKWRQAVDVRAVMSHLVASEEPDNPINAEQLAKFQPLRVAFADRPASLANSSAIFLGPQYHFQIVRPGAALYGINPTPGHANPMRAVARLSARILQVRRVDTHQSVGYGATWRAKKPSRIATIAVGYADGYLRSISNRGWVAIDGQRMPIVGRVSMDLITIDVSQSPESASAPGCEVELIGPHIAVDELADFAATNAYEIFTSLGRRYRRVYRGAAA